MNNKDILQRFIFTNLSVRGQLVYLDESFQTIMQQHDYPLPVRQALGEMLVVATLLSASIKFRGRLTVQFQGKAGLKLLLAQCNHELQLRGLAQWQEVPGQKELLMQLKQGTLAIMIDPEAAGSTRYQGLVAWQGDTLAESIEGYFKNSEQLPARIRLAIDASRAAGLLVQGMPAMDREADDWKHIDSLTTAVTPAALLGREDPAALLQQFYPQEDMQLFPSSPVCFRCSCSTERSENALRLLGQREAEEELKEKQQIVVTCEFCSREFIFDRMDVVRIFGQGKQGSSRLH